MGKFQKGILGGFSGTVGTVVGASWRGLDIMRSRPRKTNRPPTEKQAEQREKFALVAAFLRPIRPILRSYFGQPSGERSKSNLATSYHITEAIQGVYPTLAIDFEKVIIAKGELLGLQDLQVAAQSGNQLRLNWTDNSGQGQARTDDTLIIAVFNATKQQWVYEIGLASRATANHALAVPDPWLDDTVHCYVTVVSANQTKNANSVWFGGLVIV